MDSREDIEQLLSLDRQLTAAQKAEMRDHLVLYINHLLVYDFNRLIQVLYRVDVSEKKLKELLGENPQTDAAIIIAELLIQRQEEKLRTKEAFKPDNNIPEYDKW